MFMLRMLSDHRQQMSHRQSTEEMSAVPPIDVGLAGGSVPDARNEKGSIDVDARSSRSDSSERDSTSIGE